LVGGSSHAVEPTWEGGRLRGREQVALRLSEDGVNRCS